MATTTNEIEKMRDLGGLTGPMIWRPCSLSCSIEVSRFSLSLFLVLYFHPNAPIPRKTRRVLIFFLVRSLSRGPLLLLLFVLLQFRRHNGILKSMNALFWLATQKNRAAADDKQHLRPFKQRRHTTVASLAEKNRTTPSNYVVFSSTPLIIILQQSLRGTTNI